MKPEKMYYITDHRRYIILEIEVNVLQVRTIFQVVAYILCLTFYFMFNHKYRHLFCRDYYLLKGKYV